MNRVNLEERCLVNVNIAATLNNHKTLQKVKVYLFWRYFIFVLFNHVDLVMYIDIIF